VLVYYGFKLLARYVFPFLLTRWVNKKMGQFQNQSQQQYRDAEQAKQFAKEHEGEVKVNVPKKDKAKYSNDNSIDGEYVDYEEVD
tara:strand:+ start:398 stop:652 length:255 start_codon:yes stop_codon:yes gene_type:complete